MADNISALSGILAAAFGRNSLAAFAHLVADGRQWALLANHPTCRCRIAAKRFESHAGLSACFSRAAALWRLDRRAAADWGERCDLEREDYSGRESFARISQTDCCDSDLWFSRRRSSVDGFFV